MAALGKQLGIKRAAEKPKSESVPAILQRLRLIDPSLGPIHCWMATAPEIKRLLTGNPHHEKLLLNLLKTAAFLSTNNQPITLSKLGAQFFNDSKILRSGTPLKLLGSMMSCIIGGENDSESGKIAIQLSCVIDNPATTTVTLYGPLTLIRNGHPEKWIADRFRVGEPVTLNSYNLEHIEAVRLPKNCTTVITSENAAPFHELVTEAPPDSIVVYSGGYPNAAVCRLLQLLHEAGASCRHWGDTDPDGLRIAAHINRYIETTLYRGDTREILRHSNDLKPLKTEQTKRGLDILRTHPEFKFKPELELTLETGCWLEQERWHPKN